MKLAHYDDGKEKYQSHEVYVGYEFMGKISELDIDNDISIRGYGETREEALQELRQNFNKVYEKMTAFKVTLDRGSAKFVEVDCMGKVITHSSE